MVSWLNVLLLIGAWLAHGASPEHRLPQTSGICHYGNKVECCWGWRRGSMGECRPVCELSCKHGECVGPDQCRCYPGYTGKTCNQDVNECGLKPRPCKHRCMNTVGSYKCYCLSGYMMMGDGTCRNARTCAMANCQYGCAVMKGEIMCQCPSPGLRLAPDRRTCVDIDECVTGDAKCPRFRKCVNTFGSYVCKCHKGFELRYLNGKYQCTDKNDPCHDKPDSKKCKCKPGTYSRDCKPLIKVTIEPARPATTAKATTKTTTATITTTTTPPTTTAMTTTTTPTTTAMTTTTPPTTTAMPTTAAITSPTTTIKTTTPPATIPTTAAMTVPTTLTLTTLLTTADITTVPTTVPMTTAPSTTVPTTPPATSTTTTTELPTTAISTTSFTTVTTTTTVRPTAPAASSSASTSSLITTTFDNRIQKEITQRPRGDVHIPKSHGENSVFDLDYDIELGNTAEYARDDPAAGSFSCTFDLGVCSWMTEQEGDVHWETVDDPTGGRYLVVSKATTERSFKGARITISLALPTTQPWQGGNLCLAFRHRLLGHHIGSLQLFARKGRSHNPAIWTRTGSQGWRYTQITLWGRGLESLVLKAEKRRGRTGEIAVDDLSLRRGACSDVK